MEQMLGHYAKKNYYDMLKEIKYIQQMINFDDVTEENKTKHETIQINY